MGNDTYLSNSDVIKKLDDLSAAVGGTTVPTTTTKTNTDFVIGINKSIDAASGRTGVEYPPYSHNTLVTDKLDELAEAIAEGGGGVPGPTPVMGALSVTENGDYLPASYDYDGFSSVSVNVPAPPAPVMGALSVMENGDYLPSSYNYDGFSSVSVDVPEPTPNVVKVLDDGQISTESAYTTAFFDDISNFKFILIRFKDTVSSVDYDDFAMIKVNEIENEITLYPQLHRQIKVSLTKTSISAINYSGAYYNIYVDIVGLDEDIFELDYIKPIPIYSVRAPELLSVQSANKGSLVSLSYTFTSAGTYQYYVMDRTWLDDHYEFMTTVKLNGVEITSSQYIDPINADIGFKYGEITVNANDVLTVTTTQTLENYCVNLWIFRYADINSFRHIGFRGNDNSTFTINSAGVVFAEAYCTGYYNGRNNFNYLVGVGYDGLESIPTPNTSDYYYGFTYVFSLTGGNS